jgi:hypothetical protein
MAYKDEYEVARLSHDPDHMAAVRAAFGPDAKEYCARCLGHDRDRRDLAARRTRGIIVIVIAGIVIALVGLGRYLRGRKRAGSSAPPTDTGRPE